MTVLSIVPLDWNLLICIIMELPPPSYEEAISQPASLCSNWKWLSLHSSGSFSEPQFASSFVPTACVLWYRTCSLPIKVVPHFLATMSQGSCHHEQSTNEWEILIFSVVNELYSVTRTWKRANADGVRTNLLESAAYSLLLSYLARFGWRSRWINDFSSHNLLRNDKGEHGWS